MSKHNKKRNIGIVYEQLVSTVTQATIDGNKLRANQALTILKRHFSPGTELYKEFRLINSLVKTSVTSDALAARIMEEAKQSARTYSVKQLQKEKSDLIGEINRAFNKDSFYKTPVKNYRQLATIHTLIEGWRSPSPDIGLILEYETNLHTWLTQRRDENPVPVESQKTQGVNDLSVKIMRDSFNRKYGESLNESQRRLLQAIAHGLGSEPLVKEMRAQQAAALEALSHYSIQCDSSIVERKIPQVTEAIHSLNPEDTSDKNVARFMTVSQLCDELMEKKND